MKKYIPILLILLFGSHLCAQIKLKETSIDIVEKLIELNPENFEKDFTSYHQPTALYCAQLSDLVYWKHEHIEWLRDKLNELYPKNKIQTKFLEVKENNAQALLWQTNDFLVIIFRGTEFSVLRDWITDGKFWKYENTSSSDKVLKGLLPGHGGFRKSLIQFIQDKDIYGEIAKIVTFNPNYKDPKKIPIYLAGHSLGAGLSQLFINALVENGFNFCGAYHFAPPLAVDCTINDQLVTKYQAKVFDIVNGIDYVPRAGRNGVQHFGQFFRIGETGLLYKEKEAYIKFGLGDRRIKSEVAYHRIQNHIKAIRKPENDFRSINTRSAGKDYHEYIPTEKMEFCVEKK